MRVGDGVMSFDYLMPLYRVESALHVFLARENEAVKVLWIRFILFISILRH